MVGFHSGPPVNIKATDAIYGTVRKLPDVKEIPVDPASFLESSS